MKVLDLLDENGGKTQNSLKDDLKLTGLHYLSHSRLERVLQCMYFFTFRGLNGLSFGLGVEFNNFLGCTHVVEQLSFLLFLSILTIYFDLILGSFFYFLGS